MKHVGIALVGLFLAGCALDLDAKPCPCAPGFTCREGRCVVGGEDGDGGAGMDAGVDGGRAPMDAGRDAGPDASADGGPDAGGMDAAARDGGLDAGSDAGPPGPIFHLTCESLSGTRVLDVSGNERHARCDTDAGCPRIVPGRVGNGCDFTSDEVRLRVEYDPVFVPGRTTSTFTVSLWVRPRGTGLASAIGLPQGASLRNTWQATVTGTRVFDGGGGPGTDAGVAARLAFVSTDEIEGRTLSAPMAVELDAWVHVALTYDGSTKALWLDGQTVATSPDETLLSTEGEDRAVFIGADENLGDELALPLDGVLDDVRYYDRVLTRAEIEALADP